MRVWHVQDKLYVQNQLYTVDTIHRLPDSIQPHKAAINEDADHIFFFSGQSQLSNFHIKKFKIDVEVYVCPEQYIESQKAKFAKCYNVAKQVLETNVPSFK